MRFLPDGWGFGCLCSTSCCLPDLDLDNVVGASDLAILLGAWGACDWCASGAAQAAMQEASVEPPEASDPNAAMIEALQVYGFTDASTFGEWFDSLPPDDQLSVSEMLLSIFVQGSAGS